MPGDPGLGRLGSLGRLHQPGTSRLIPVVVSPLQNREATLYLGRVLPLARQAFGMLQEPALALDVMGCVRLLGLAQARGEIAGELFVAPTPGRDEEPAYQDNDDGELSLGFGWRS